VGVELDLTLIPAAAPAAEVAGQLAAKVNAPAHTVGIDPAVAVLAPKPDRPAEPSTP
jgi:hypothetical protein